MSQNNKEIDKSDLSRPNYSPEDDPEVQEDIEDKLNYIRDKFDPYQRQIMVVGIIILILLVVFLGVAYGGMRVCSDLDGLLDSKFKCHPNYNPIVNELCVVGQPLVIPGMEEWNKTP